MIEHTLYTAKIDFAIYLTFWDLSIMDIVKKNCYLRLENLMDAR